LISQDARDSWSVTGPGLATGSAFTTWLVLASLALEEVEEEEDEEEEEDDEDEEDEEEEDEDRSPLESLTREKVNFLWMCVLTAKDQCHGSLTRKKDCGSQQAIRF